MTIAKDITSKASVALVVLAMIFTLFAQSAKAETSEDLQKVIDGLLAQIATLQSQLGQGGSTTGSTTTGNGYVWTRDLSQGSTGADVKALQVFLNSDADTRVAATGAGSVGMETEYYGPATAAAVSKFQVKYRSEILSPSGLVNPTGYFGPSSRAVANAQNAQTSTPTTPTTPGEEEEEEEEGETTTKPVVLQGEADLKTFEINDAEDDSIEEGDKNVEVATFNAEFEEGDAKITRLDVKLVNASSTSAWKAFKSFALWVDGEKVAEVNADAKSNYKDSGLDKYSVLRFTGLDIVALEDEEVEITLSATVQNSVKLAEQGTWTVTVPSIRYVDGDGVSTTDDETDDLGNAGSAKFTIGVAGAKDEIIVRNSTKNPAETQILLKDSKNSDEVTILAFDIDTKDSVNDLDIDEVKAKVTFSNNAGVTHIDDVAEFKNLVDSLDLVIDGKTVRYETGSSLKVTSATSSASSTDYEVVFNVDNKVTVKAGDRVPAEIRAKFKSGNKVAFKGTTISATVVGTGITAEGVDTVTDLTGTVVGKNHTFTDKDLTISNVKADKTTDSVTGFIEYTFDVKAGDDDVNIKLADLVVSFTGNATASVGVLETLSNSSTVKTNGANDFDIYSGMTGKFRVTYTITGAGGTYKEGKLETIKGETFDVLSGKVVLKS